MTGAGPVPSVSLARVLDPGKPFHMATTGGVR